MLEDTMRPYYGKYRQYEAFLSSGLKDEDGEERTAPEKPDLRALATAAGLKWGETGMVDGVALAQTPCWTRQYSSR